MKKILPSLVLFIIAAGINGATLTKTKVSLKESFRIRDDTGEFYFKSPNSPVIAENGDIFIIDENELLRFSASGKFCGNLWKKGAGPGEMQDARGVIPGEGSAAVFDSDLAKILLFDDRNELTGEFRTPSKLANKTLIGACRDRFYFTREEYHSTAGKVVEINIPVRLYSWKPGEKDAIDLGIIFSRKYFIRDTNWIQNIHYLQICTLNPCSLLICNTGDYRIPLLNLDAAKPNLSAFISKKFSKTPFKTEWYGLRKETAFKEKTPLGEQKKTLVRKYADDILRIWMNGEKIWILTSRYDEKTGAYQVDIFSKKGEFQDSFALSFPIQINPFRLSFHPMALGNGKLYMFEENEESEWELACYGFIGIPGWAE